MWNVDQWRKLHSICMVEFIARVRCYVRNVVHGEYPQGWHVHVSLRLRQIKVHGRILFYVQ